MTTKAYSYIRFSSPEQAEGDSYRRQIEAAEKYAREKGLELVRDDEYAYFDKGVSAFTGENLKGGSLGRFLEHVKGGDIQGGSYLLVESLDRLSRQNPIDAFGLFVEILRAGITIVTVMESQCQSYTKDADTALIMYAVMQMAGAHTESARKSSRVRDAWGNKKRLAQEERKPLGGGCPLWLKYVKDEDRYELIQDRVGVVKIIFELSIQGYGRGRIAKYLNEKGIAPWKARKKSESALWGTSSVAKVLNNRGVLGEYHPHKRIYNEKSDKYERLADGEVVKGFYPAIISEEDFYRAHASSTERRITKQTKTGGNFSNIFQGVANCSFCGASMVLVNKGKSPKGSKYLCCSKAKVGGCYYHGYRYELAERIFMESLLKVPSLTLVQEDFERVEREIAVKSEKYQELEKQRLSLKEALKKSGTSLVTLVEAVSELEEESGVIWNELEKLKEKRSAGNLVRDRDGFLAELDLESYEGRYRANKLFVRLGIKFRFECLQKSKAEVSELGRLVYEQLHGKKPSKGQRNDILDSLWTEKFHVYQRNQLLMEWEASRSQKHFRPRLMAPLKAAVDQGDYEGNEVGHLVAVMDVVAERVLRAPDFNDGELEEIFSREAEKVLKEMSEDEKPPRQGI